MSVSVPFLTPSAYLGTAHAPPEHTLLVQSVAAAHILPSAHFGAPTAPPQSTSVSVPFFTPSMVVGA
jgi:hypothetical protein